MDLTNEKLIDDVSPLPKEDYKKNGKLKTIRGRMVKKLLRYEFKAHFQMLIPFYVVLFFLATTVVIMGNIWWATYENTEFYGLLVFLIITTLCLIIMGFVTVLTPIGTCTERIRKNFFGKEGYLTLSTPVSAEEHLFAKHFSAIVCLILSSIVCILVAVYVIFAGGFYADADLATKIEFSPVTANSFFLGVEDFINSIIGSVEIVVAFGAAVCFLQKISPKARVLLVIGVIIGLNIISQVFVSLLMYTPIFEFLATPVGQHIGNLFETIFGIAIIIGCVYYELRRIKYNINLE